MYELNYMTIASNENVMAVDRQVGSALRAGQSRPTWQCNTLSLSKQNSSTCNGSQQCISYKIGSASDTHGKPGGGANGSTWAVHLGHGTHSQRGRASRSLRKRLKNIRTFIGSSYVIYRQCNAF